MYSLADLTQLPHTATQAVSWLRVTQHTDTLRQMASSPPHGACIVLMPPKMLVRHVDNSSMNGPESSASTNLGKNSNVMTEKTVQRVAQQFMGGFKFEATGMVMCPSRRATGNPKTWCSAYREAIKHLTGQRQV